MTNLVELMTQTKGRFFTVEFIKKDGTTRTLNGRLGVKKHLKGGASTLNDNFVVVYDVQAHGYRAVNKGTIQAVKFKGVRWSK